MADFKVLPTVNGVALKVDNVSATDRLLGRVSASSGAIEEIAISDYFQSLFPATDASAARTTLGLVAGGAGDIWAEKAGDTFTGNVAITSAAAAGYSFSVIRNQPLATSDSPTAFFQNLNAGDDKPVMDVQQAIASGVYAARFLGGDGIYIESTTPSFPRVAMYRVNSATDGYIGVLGDGLYLVTGQKMYFTATGDYGFNAAIPTGHTNFANVHHGFSGNIMAHKTATQTYYNDNAYFDGAWKRKNIGLATYYLTGSGIHSFATAVTGAANSAITWAEIMRMTPNGLGIGTTDVEAWDAAFTGMNIGGGGFWMASDTTGGLRFGDAVYFDGAWKRRQGSQPGIIFTMATGEFSIATSDAGTIDTTPTLTTRVYMNTSGDMGFNTSDIEVGHASYGAFQLGLFSYMLYGKAGGAAGLHLAENAYYDGTWKRRSANVASAIFVQGGSINFQQAVTSTINSAITWVESMRILADGRVGIGTSTPAGTEANSRFTVEGSDGTAFYTGVINTGAGQVATVLRRTGTTPSRWVSFIPAGLDELQFYSGTLAASILTLGVDGSVEKRAGGAAAVAKVGGFLYVMPTPVGNVGTGTDTLLTYTLPAGTVTANGGGIRVRLGVLFANNAAAKTFVVSWGGTAYLTLTPAINATHRLVMDIYITRTSATTGWLSAIYGLASSPGGVTNLYASEQVAGTYSGAITFLVTGAATSNVDIYMQQAVVEIIEG